VLDRRHPAFVLVHRQFQPPVQIRGKAGFDALARPFALDQDQKVVGLICQLRREAVLSCFQFPSPDSSSRMLARSGESGPPCGVPISLGSKQSPIITSARRYRPMSPSSRLSPTRCSRGLRHHVLTRPQTEPSMQFLSGGSHFCTPASFGQFLAGLPLPSASGYPRRMQQAGYSHRGLHPISSCPCRAHTLPSSGRSAHVKRSPSRCGWLTKV